jgi:hypothetical protein
MARVKKEKEIIYYQILNSENKPVRLLNSFSEIGIIPVKCGKSFNGRARAISHVRRFLAYVQNPPAYFNVKNNAKFKVEANFVEKDELIKEIFALKIQAFRPAEIEDLTFHLDKLK